MVWSGLRVIEVVEKDETKVNECVDLIRQLQVKYNVNTENVIVDEDGVGGGVRDYLGCLGFINNSRPIQSKTNPQNFASLDQCYYHLAEYINRNEVYVNCSDTVQKLLTQELEWVRLPKEVDTSKIKLLGKDKIKEQIKRSPDYSDALMLRIFFTMYTPRPNYVKSF